MDPRTATVAEVVAAGGLDGTTAAPIGHNNPPAPTPYEAIKLHIDDLFETAQGFLDGEPIDNEKQAEAVSKLLDEARKARAAAEAQRKLEAKPFDDGKAAVQALWTPLTDEKKGRCALIIETCKKALAPWLEKLDAEKRAAEAEARRVAEEKVAAAQAARRAADGTDLAALERAEQLTSEAEEAQSAATRASNDKAHAKGGSRAVTLRTVYRAEITDIGAALDHYAFEDGAEIIALLQRLADRDVRAGKRSIPGVVVHEDRVPV